MEREAFSRSERDEKRKEQKVNMNKIIISLQEIVKEYSPEDE